MVHHIVMWNFKPEIKEEDKPALKAAMKVLLFTAVILLMWRWLTRM